MQIRFSDELEKVVEYARDEAMRTGYYAICTEHLLLGMLRHENNAACEALSAEGLDLDILKRRIDAQILRGESIPYEEMDEVGLSREAENTLSLAILEASISDRQEAGAGELLLAIERSEGNPCRDILSKSGIDRARLLTRLRTDREGEKASTPSRKDLQNALLFGLERVGNFIDNDTKIYS